MSEKDKICPRCKKKFVCQSDNISACACSGLLISNATRTFLAQTFYSCVCAECLRELDTLVAKQKEFPFPGRGGELIEGVHYYKEDIYRVFTEFYLISRGYCCRSGCRHCPYGFKEKYME